MHSLTMFKDYVAIVNTSNPHGDRPISLDRFAPFSKNPTISKFFMQLGLVDELGSGILNVNKYLKYYSSGQPEFIEGNVFRVLIPLGDQKGEGTNATVNATVNDLIVHAFGKEINTKVRERLGRIVSFIQNEPGSRANAITEGVELSKSIVRRELTNLINNDVIEFVGAPKTGGYRLKNNSSKK
jgi:ATP-dependent DNA helicase RecG